MKHIAIFFTAILAVASSVAQTVVIYPKSGDAIADKMSDIDHIEFLPDGSADNRDESGY